MTTITTVQSATTPTMRRSTIVLVARLRRLLNGWAAAAIAYRERQDAQFVRQCDDRELDSTRIYRSPIDEAVEKAARLRKRRRLKQP
ncbi:hypothetical protein ACFIOY_10220 [Bradyrhizobium sp. TZ2]